MKVSFQDATKGHESCNAPVIGLSPPKEKDYSDSATKFSGKSVKIALRTNPTSTDSETIDRYFPIFEEGTPEEWLLWKRSFESIRKGLNLTTGATVYGMIHQLLSGEVLRGIQQEGS